MPQKPKNTHKFMYLQLRTHTDDVYTKVVAYRLEKPYFPLFLCPIFIYFLPQTFALSYIQYTTLNMVSQIHIARRSHILTGNT